MESRLFTLVDIIMLLLHSVLYFVLFSSFKSIPIPHSSPELSIRAKYDGADISAMAFTKAAASYQKPENRGIWLQQD